MTSTVLSTVFKIMCGLTLGYQFSLTSPHPPRALHHYLPCVKPCGISSVPSPYQAYSSFSLFGKPILLFVLLGGAYSFSFKNLLMSHLFCEDFQRFFHVYLTPPTPY